jgi:hypothetical protein
MNGNALNEWYFPPFLFFGEWLNANGFEISPSVNG